MLLCGVICAAVGTAGVAKVQAAPTAGIISIMSGSTAPTASTEQSTAVVTGAAEQTSAQNQLTAGAMQQILVNTDSLDTSAKTASVDEGAAAPAEKKTISGVMLAIADNLTEASAKEAETETEMRIIAAAGVPADSQRQEAAGSLPGFRQRAGHETECVQSPEKCPIPGQVPSSGVYLPGRKSL